MAMLELDIGKWTEKNFADCECGRVIDLVGPPPNSARCIYVFDHGADSFEVFFSIDRTLCWLKNTLF